MSLLPATSHANPTDPFWATSGAASGITTIAAGAGITVTGGTGPTATITNSGIRTLTAGTGMTITAGSTPTVTNSGVTSIVAGQGITVSGATGAVTITNNGTADIQPLSTSTPASFGGGTPASLGTFTLGKQYQYAEGYGFIRMTGGTYATAPTITVYLSSGSSALPLDLTKSVGYILQPQSPGGVVDLTGYYFDLSTIKHYDPAGGGFSSITLTWLTDSGGINIGFSPVGATSGFTNSTTADVTTTKLTTARTGAAGFKFFTNV